ncbi:hypothetical protein [Nocardia otitidiscaviarum]|uniref:hypothetical protein n=1 Tax=Nocardia otitidiscaviarum TaxID=1823 RepID=UPI00245721BF|nr:hypothetical protein [Nocardia otitidiscaviarum]
MPGGLAMAERAADRDGLTLDEVTVSLGPVLSSWPAGLVVTARVQGGIVSRATVSVLAAPKTAESFWLQPWVGRGGAAADGRVRRRYAAARQVDSVATLLTVAGWEDAAWAGRRLRDMLLTGAGGGAGATIPSGSEVGGGGAATDEKTLGHRWIRRMRRSRTLRWSLRDVGAVVNGPGVPRDLVGDTWDRLDARLAEIGRSLSGSWWDREVAGHDRATAGWAADFAAVEKARADWIVGALPELLTGVTLAEARLIVAGLDPDLDLSRWASREGAHG